MAVKAEIHYKNVYAIVFENVDGGYILNKCVLSYLGIDGDTGMPEYEHGFEYNYLYGSLFGALDAFNTFVYRMMRDDTQESNYEVRYKDFERGSYEQSFASYFQDSLDELDELGLGAFK